jgi:hypothetical protein
VCSVLMVRVAEMRSVGHVFDELAEQSGTDGMTGSPRGQLEIERRVYGLWCGGGSSRSESEAAGISSCREQIDGKCGSRLVHLSRRV